MKLNSSKTTAVGRRGALRWLIGGLVGIALAGPVAPTSQAQWFGNWWRTAAAKENVYDTLKAKANYSTLVAAIDAAELQDAVATLEDITVFAPTNRAFAAIPADDLGALLEDKEALTQVLLYHVLGVRAESRDVESGEVETLLEGENVELRVKKYWGGRYRTINVNDARVVDADVEASNGVIHGINSVLNPGFERVPTLFELAASDPNFSTLAGLVEQAGLAAILAQDYRKLTVFAPTNAAFEAVPAEALAAVASDPRQLRKVLLNHLLFRKVTSGDLESGTIRSAARLPLEVVVSDAGITIGGANAGPADIEASNGVLHVIDAVLLPAAPTSIVDVAQSREELGTLVTALGVAGLVETFDSTKRYPAYTVFAPNNDAFGALPEGALDALVADPEALGGVLALHVVPGRLEAKKLRDGQKLRTLSGDRLEVSVGDDGVKINGVAVVEADLKAENGVIHVIGGVLADEPYTIADAVAEKRYLSTLAAAVEAAGLAGALDDASAELTVVAPTNRAFDALPAGTVEALLEDPTGALADILKYHVLPGTLDASSLIEAGSAATLLGPDVEVTKKSYRFWFWSFDRVMINNARVVVSDVKTDNGIVHVIDAVLLPPGDGDEG